ncbi:MAG: VPGUxxT family thioredoxin-like (seleno)protein, type 2 [Candidatus Eisenbacteria bacterium]|nr:VPGUxxT family thioredoxin-like (seleno)protein, type 2 [Candidatus Eisenbacteria bacterium]
MAYIHRILTTLLLGGGLFATPDDSWIPAVSAANPRELGDVTWRRDWDVAAAESRRNGRPLLVLFQEIPGCATCVGFGDGALSNPRLVEVIETLFVPLAIHNNKPGADRVILERFREPAWNNPVVRFLDADGNDWIPRKDGVWSEGALSRRMLAALEKSGQPAPGWFRLVVEEIDADDPQRLYLAMHCFWEGEARLGTLDGLLATRAGFIDGKEVVEVTYDAVRLPADRLITEARKRGVAGESWTGNQVPFREAPASDQKRHLSGTRWESVAHLSPLQAARINSALASGAPAGPFLTPRQAVTAR